MVRQSEVTKQPKQNNLPIFLKKAIHKGIGNAASEIQKFLITFYFGI